jgi:hypothetical protein
VVIVVVVVLSERNPKRSSRLSSSWSRHAYTNGIAVFVSLEYLLLLIFKLSEDVLGMCATTTEWAH